MIHLCARPDFIQRTAWIGSDEPVTVAELKAQVRFAFGNEDTLIAGYIASARERCEAEINQRIRRQRLEMIYSGFGDGLRLDRAGHQVQVESVAYVDINGDTQTWSSNDYEIKKGNLFVVAPKVGRAFPNSSAFSESRVVVTLQAGYASAAEVPQAIKNWIMAQAASMFRNRESHGEKAAHELQFLAGLIDDFRVGIV